MISHTTSRFRKAFQQLPAPVQQRARDAFKAWQEDPRRLSLRFKQVHATRPIYSVRIGIHWRALGVRRGEEMIWFWIGSHSNYDKLISQL